jgi:hypothetical protein
VISYLLFVFALIIFIRTCKKPDGENNENKIRKVELVLKTSMRKKIWAFLKPSRKQSWQKLEYTLENSHEKNQNIFGAKWKTSK